MEELRYGPFVNEKFLFDPALLQKIATEREAITDKRLSAAALSSIASNVYRSQSAVAAKVLKRRPMAATAIPSVEASSNKAKTASGKGGAARAAGPLRGAGLRNSEQVTITARREG